MTVVRLASIIARGTPEPWGSVGFAVDDEGRVALANGALAFRGDGGGLVGLAVDGVSGLPAEIEGIPVEEAAPVAPIEQPNGAFELDHVVIMTGSLERTSDAVADVLGLARRRIRETERVRQAFHRFADQGGGRGCIVELVERPGLDRTALWGLVVNVADLDAVVAAHPAAIGVPKPAVQPGRRIATVRGAAGLGVPVALMTPG